MNNLPEAIRTERDVLVKADGIKAFRSRLPQLLELFQKSPETRDYILKLDSTNDQRIDRRRKNTCRGLEWLKRGLEELKSSQFAEHPLVKSALSDAEAVLIDPEKKWANHQPALADGINLDWKQIDYAYQKVMHAASIIATFGEEELFSRKKDAPLRQVNGLQYKLEPISNDLWIKLRLEDKIQEKTIVSFPIPYARFAFYPDHCRRTLPSGRCGFRLKERGFPKPQDLHPKKEIRKELKSKIKLISGKLLLKDVYELAINLGKGVAKLQVKESNGFYFFHILIGNFIPEPPNLILEVLRAPNEQRSRDWFEMTSTDDAALWNLLQLIGKNGMSIFQYIPNTKFASWEKYDLFQEELKKKSWLNRFDMLDQSKHPYTLNELIVLIDRFLGVVSADISKNYFKSLDQNAWWRQKAQKWCVDKLFQKLYSMTEEKRASFTSANAFVDLKELANRRCVRLAPHINKTMVKREVVKIVKAKLLSEGIKWKPKGGRPKGSKKKKPMLLKKKKNKSK